MAPTPILITVRLICYMGIVNVGCHRSAMIKRITSRHRLAIETGRWARPVVPRDQRACPVCSVSPEDEYHLILICPLYGNIRKALIPKCYHNRPPMYKLVLLFNDARKMVIKNLANLNIQSFYFTKDLRIIKRPCATLMFTTLLNLSLYLGSV